MKMKMVNGKTNDDELVSCKWKYIIICNSKSTLFPPYENIYQTKRYVCSIWSVENLLGIKVTHTHTMKLRPENHYNIKYSSFKF